MDRVLIGKGTTNTTSSYYHRSGKQGLYVSKPGANVNNCPDGDLMFDSTTPTFLQILGRGAATVPSQTYSYGVFGEKYSKENPGEPLLTDDNWRLSGEGLPKEINAQTSWLFDGLKSLRDDIKSLIETFAIPYKISLPEQLIEELAEVQPPVGPIELEPNSWTIDNLAGEIGTPEHSLENYEVTGWNRTIPLKDVWKYEISDEDLQRYYDYAYGVGWHNLPQTDLGNSKGVYEFESLWDVWFNARAATINWNTVAEQSRFIVLFLFSMLPNLDDDDYIRKMIAKYWRIIDVFPFFADIPLGAGLNVKSSIDEVITNTENNFNGSQLPEVFYSGISTETPSYYFDGNRYVLVPDQEAIGTDKNALIYTHGDSLWQNAWYNYIQNNTVYNASGIPVHYATYPDKTAYSGESMAMDASFLPEMQHPENLNFPRPWRAWTDERTGKFSVYAERQAAAEFYHMMLLFSFLQDDVGNFVNSNPEAWEYKRQPSDYFFNIVSTRPGYTIDSGNPSSFLDYHYRPKASATTRTWKSINPKNNWGYSHWSDGKIEVSSGIAPPLLNSPVQVWWNPISRRFGNTVMNLTFLESKANLIKEATSEKRIRLLKPEVPTIYANTYVQDNDLKIAFEHPSSKEEAQVYFTFFKEVASEVIFARIELDITDINDPNNPGNNYAGRRSIPESEGGTGDGRYYTVVFPDDFIKTRGSESEEDPFHLYRNADGKIDKRLQVTLNIPEGVELSGNGHNNHITLEQLSMVSGLPAFQGATAYGPKDTDGRGSQEKFAMVDPCIKINLNSTEWTETALRGLEIKIENNGTMVGAGGWGQYGQMVVPDKWQYKNPGGGGGGGAGYHPTLEEEFPQVDWIGAANILTPTWAVQTSADGEPGVQSSEEVDVTLEASSTHWQGPNNYVEWGIGRDPISNTAFTYMDQISWDSVGPGKPGTGYLGATPHTIINQPPTEYPYYDSFASIPSEGPFIDIYSRLPGTYWYEDMDTLVVPGEGVQAGVSANDRRFESAGWGNPGTAGTTESGGAGGAEVMVTTPGYSQHPHYNAGYDVTIFGVGDGSGDGYPYSGNGGACVYLVSNVSFSVSGTKVELINKTGGIMKTGGGGGSGGNGTEGLGGGDLGKPGKGYPGMNTNEDALSNGFRGVEEGGQKSWHDWTRRGEPGKLVWWNTSNLTSSYTVTNESTNKSYAIEGMDYNSEIGDWDYVSYAPDISKNGINYKGMAIWSRKTGTEFGQLVYTAIGERSFEDYFDSL